MRNEITSDNMLALVPVFPRVFTMEQKNLYSSALQYSHDPVYLALRLIKVRAYIPSDRIVWKALETTRHRRFCGHDQGKDLLCIIEWVIIYVYCYC